MRWFYIELLDYDSNGVQTFFRASLGEMKIKIRLTNTPNLGFSNTLDYFIKKTGHGTFLFSEDSSSDFPLKVRKQTEIRMDDIEFENEKRVLRILES